MTTRASEEPASRSTPRNHGSFCHKAALLADFDVKSVKRNIKS